MVTREYVNSLYRKAENYCDDGMKAMEKKDFAMARDSFNNSLQMFDEARAAEILLKGE